MITASDVLVIMRNNGEYSLNGIPEEPLVIYKAKSQLLSYVSIRADKANLLRLVANASEPSGWNYDIVHQYHPSGGFILNDVKIKSRYDYSWAIGETGWANHHPLEICLYLSRIVNPIPTGLKCVARCFFEGDRLVSIAPHEYLGWATAAYLPMPPGEAAKQRSWFTQEEIGLLGEMIDSFLNNSLPKRLFGLLWFYVVAFSMDIRTMRWQFLSQSLHSAVCTDSSKVRKQFITRLPAFAAEAGVTLEKEDVQRLWEYRSKMAHAYQMKEPTLEEISLMEKAESVIRSSIISGLLNSEFSSCWGSTETIRKHWPVE